MDEILNLIESVSEGFPSYFCEDKVFLLLKWLNLTKSLNSGKKLDLGTI